jgi:hypothetical protein
MLLRCVHFAVSPQDNIAAVVRQTAGAIQLLQVGHVWHVRDAVQLCDSLCQPYQIIKPRALRLATATVRLIYTS